MLSSASTHHSPAANSLPDAHSPTAGAHVLGNGMPPHGMTATSSFPTLGLAPVSPADSILRRRAVSEIVGLGNSSIYKYIKAGNFPRPRKLGARSVGWLASEIFEWVASRGHND